MHENRVSGIIVDAAIEIHQELGPGLLESVYEAILCRELRNRGLRVQNQVVVPLVYKNLHFEQAFRADLIVERSVLVELKAVESINNVCRRQLLTYLRLSGMQLGLILNFGESLMRRGIIRMVNQLKE